WIVGEAVIEHPGRGRRQQSQPPLLRPGIGERYGHAWVAVGLGGSRRDLDPAARGRKAQVGELDVWLVLQPDGSLRRQRLEVEADTGAPEYLGDHLLVALVQRWFLITHRGGEATEDLGVRKRLPDRFGRFDLRREAAMKVGDDQVVALEEAGRRE